MRLLFLFPILLAFPGGCSWVTGEELDCQLQLVDEDGDGYPLNRVQGDYSGAERCEHLVPVDCDDADPSVHPDALEQWYDGVDADCGGEDDYDADGDGYVPDAYAGLVTAGVEGSGGLPGGDCADADPSVHPGVPDTWYDGVDSDCGGEDDYDADGDGYVPDAYAGLPTRYLDGSGSLPAGDCDDADSSVHPGVPDTWYDGVDSDCGGEDDYDADGDGYVPEGYEGLSTEYVEGSGALPGGDCDDADPSVHPGAVDAWYDGVDADCGGEDDYDADGDGSRSTLAVDGDDCDDADPSVHPGAEELLGDGLDSDCDGGEDSFLLASPSGLGWEDVQGLGLAASDEAFYLAISGALLSYEGTEWYDSALALVYSTEEAVFGEPEDVFAWLQYLADPSDTSLSPGLDVLVEEDALYGVVGLLHGDERQLSVRRYALGGSTSRNNATPSLGTGLGFDGVALALDDAGSLHAVGCSATASGDALAYAWVTESSLEDSNLWDCAETLDLPGAPCALAVEGDQGLLALGPAADADDSLQLYGFTPCTPGDASCCPDFEPLAELAEAAPPALRFVELDTGPGLLYADGESGDLVLLDLAEPSAPEELLRLWPGAPAVGLDATVVDGSLLLAVAWDADGGLALLYRQLDPPGSSGLVRLSTGDVLVERAALAAEPSGQLLLVAAEGEGAAGETLLVGGARLVF